MCHEIIVVNYFQDIFGALTVMAVSSGYSLGSCNWIIHSGYEKIAYVSASSTLTTHPRSMQANTSFLFEINLFNTTFQYTGRWIKWPLGMPIS